MSQPEEPAATGVDAVHEAMDADNPPRGALPTNQADLPDPVDPDHHTRRQRGDSDPSDRGPGSDTPFPEGPKNWRI